MNEQTSLHQTGLIGLPKMDLKALESCDDSALFHALRRIMADPKPAVAVSRFNSYVGSASSGKAEPSDDLS
ncbi:hypothetical protein [Actinomadura sp. 7K534]|uniref:hypothetical protein n=1 Tax=Actinomadura sp. 7K534 TaxID=2530366 RepID=UPI0010479144|nr:hypothetical protein [Actinomadura sp. 7K534]TDB91989.1 hypothetical protein E1266_25875 [Actinomadura sp. 7K534]